MKTSPRYLTLLLAGAAVFSAGSLHAQAPAANRSAEKKYVPYRITRGDVLNIIVVNEEIPATPKRVEAVGTVNLTYIGDVRLVGLTLKEAQELIEKSYFENRILRNPTVNVVVETYSARIVRISGKVNSPGPINIPPDTETTIVELISKANGLTETAKGSAVCVARTMPDGSTKVFVLNVDAALKAKGSAKSADASFVVEPDDIVYVDEKII
ncbi:MAG TPA: polysaccharide biosynthesis/export family protein [Opitutaceae bacterium]|nr:polysaccharide biosynthesis/export family protein [Opitutaceae bacterium]